MLTRILIVVVLVGLALWLLKRALGRPDRRQSPPPKASSRPKDKSTAETLDLVACHHCGLHLPRTEALWRESKPFCSEAHADQGRHPSGP